MLRYLMAYPKKNFSYPGPSMWFSNRINWIISDVQAKKFFLIIFLASNKVLAMLGSWIGTCSVFFSFIFSLTWGEILSLLHSWNFLRGYIQFQELFDWGMQYHFQTQMLHLSICRKHHHQGNQSKAFWVHSQQRLLFLKDIIETTYM